MAEHFGCVDASQLAPQAGESHQATSEPIRDTEHFAILRFAAAHLAELANRRCSQSHDSGTVTYGHSIALGLVFREMSAILTDLSSHPLCSHDSIVTKFNTLGIDLTHLT